MYIVVNFVGYFRFTICGEIVDVVYAIPLHIYSTSSPHLWPTHVNVLLKLPQSVDSMIRYDAAGLLVLVECHHSFSAFNGSSCTTLRSGVVRLLGGSKYTFLKLKVPRIDSAMDWLIHHPNDQRTQKVKEIRSFMLAFFFSSRLRVFSAHYFVNFPPFLNSYPGWRGTQSSPFPTTVRAFVLIAKKKKVRMKFPPLASPCVKLVCILVT